MGSRSWTFQRDFKLFLINMFKKQKGTMVQELKETVMVMTHTKENRNKEIQIIKKNQVEIPYMKTIIMKMKNSLDSFNRRFKMAKERINGNYPV